jgi:release factor glutamine methyltransferase
MTGRGTIGELLRGAAARLDEAGALAGRLEAEVLLAHVTGRGRASLLAGLRDELEPPHAGRLEELVARRIGGEPLQYLTGLQEFRSMPFRVDPRVLIPRPETEGVVDEAVRLLRGHPGPRIVDVGTGSGCIAVALAAQLPGAEIVAVDASPDALQVARANAAALAPGASLRFVEGNLLEPVADLAGTVDLIVSNPPYVAAGEVEALPREVRDHEPRAALVSGETGLEAIGALVAAAPELLRPAAALVLEIGHGQWPRVRELILATPHYTPPTVIPDFQHIPRIVSTRKR